VSFQKILNYFEFVSFVYYSAILAEWIEISKDLRLNENGGAIMYQ
jgi:hypothetical protein